MNAVDGMVLALLALADITLIVHLRRRRARTMRVNRMYRSLTLAVRRELAATAPITGKLPARKLRATADALRKRFRAPGLREVSAQS